MKNLISPLSTLQLGNFSPFGSFKQNKTTTQNQKGVVGVGRGGEGGTSAVRRQQHGALGAVPGGRFVLLAAGKQKVLPALLMG